MDFQTKLHRETLLQQKDQYEARTYIEALVNQGRAPTLNLFRSRFDGSTGSISNYERYPWVSWMISNGCLIIHPAIPFSHRKTTDPLIDRTDKQLAIIKANNAFERKASRPYDGTQRIHKQGHGWKENHKS